MGCPVLEISAIQLGVHAFLFDHEDIDPQPKQVMQLSNREFR